MSHLSPYKKAAVSGKGVPDETKKKVHSLYTDSEKFPNTTQSDKHPET